jgi:hypothetical protein
MLKETIVSINHRRTATSTNMNRMIKSGKCMPKSNIIRYFKVKKEKVGIKLVL